MNKFVKKITKGIILSMILMFVLNLTAIQLDNKTENHNQVAITENSFIPSAMAEDPLDDETQDLIDNYGADNSGDESVDDLFESSSDANNEEPEETFDPEKFMASITDKSRYIHSLFSPLVNFFSFNIGNFLGNDHIYGGAMGAMLKKIWVVSRNLVNILFVLILLFIALKEIFWVKEEGGTDLKKSLLTFVLLLVAVNFSWLVTKVVLDAANIATNVVFAIPMGINSDGTESKIEPCEIYGKQNDDGKIVMKASETCYPTAIYSPFDAKDGSTPHILYANECEQMEIEKKYNEMYPDGEDADGNALPDKPDEGNRFYGHTTWCYDTLDFAKYDQNASVIYLTYGMARIQNLATSASTTSITKMSIGILFSLVIQVAFTVALLALFLALIIRMAVLWLFVAFSPFMVLLLFSDVIGPLAEGAKGKVDFSAFLKWAFVPVKVGAVFTVAFLMISTGQTLGGGSSSTINPISSGGAEVTSKMFKVDTLFMGLGSIEQFMWLLITLAVLWMGVFAVLGEMPIIRNITDKIKGYGVDTAKLVATTPYWAPIMPMIDPGTGKFKIGSYEKEFKGYGLKGMLETAKEKALDKKPAEKAGEINKIEQEKINKMSADEAFKAVKGHVGATAQEIEKHGDIDKIIGEMKHLDKNGKDAIKQGYKNALGISKAVKPDKPAVSSGVKSQVEIDQEARAKALAEKKVSDKSGTTTPATGTPAPGAAVQPPPPPPPPPAE